ncbi:MAG: haloacid dehalogenase [Candidatus Tectimicrobiota bacterium]|nr:MAG: haloacid dehalogenase [Candidatus Tectomicrobia bacterium]
MPAVQGCVFDAYGTLFDVHSVIAACREVAPDAPALSETWRAKQLEYTWLRALMGHYEDFWVITEAALRYALRRHGLRLAPAQQQRLLEAYYRLDTYPEVPAALQQLRQRYPLAILSNGSPAMLQAVIAHNRLQEIFTQVLSADAVRTYKPHPAVYELAPRHLSIPKTALLFVSSNAFDAIGAKAFGFQVAWINRSGAPLDELGFVPDFEIQRLDELPARLASSP